ncbi:helix-turn-helix transcriptional regulator [Streptomyces sp. NPDC001787]|uniref:helix-turn-helix domain-containing protein n=1 Tax=Streptomyces sp. NPDC001787 TaxID=3154523 RepID=UPI003319043C
MIGHVRPAAGPPAARGGGRPPDPVRLTSREELVLELLAKGMTRRGVAVELQATEASVGRHIVRLRRKLGVRSTSVRSLLCAAYTQKVRAVPVVPVRSRARPKDEPHLVDVWRLLGADVEDHELVPHIADEVGLPAEAVDLLLRKLRGCLSPNWAEAVHRGFGYGYLPAPPRPALPPARKAAPRWQDPIRTATNFPAAATGADDPLGLLPHPAADPVRDGLHHLTDSSGTCVTNKHAQAVHLVPGVCRTVLRSVPEERWGPVLGDVQGQCAVLFLRPDAVQGRWKGTGARLVRGGYVYRLPPAGGRRDGRYWAVAPAARFWDARELLYAVGGDHALSLSDLAPVAAAGTNLLSSGRRT